MASPASTTRQLRAVCVFLLVLGLLSAGYALWQRVRAEAATRAVEIVVDYNEVIALAGSEGVLPNNVLTRLTQGGATAVAVPEETLKTMEEEGAINIVAHPNPQGTYFNGWAPSDQVFVIDGDPAVVNFVYEQLKKIYPEQNLSFRGIQLFIRGDREEMQDIGLGLDPAKVKLVRDYGLRVVPRLHGSPILTNASLDASIQSVAQVLGQGASVWTPQPTAKVGTTESQLGIVIFDGDTIPGYRALIPELADQLNNYGLVYGSVEFAKQKGDTALGKALKGSLVRVHSISKEELAAMTPGQAVGRFGLAVKDRNIRVLYVHFPPVVGSLTSGNASRIEDAAHYVNAIKKELSKNGFSASLKKQAHPLGILNASKRQQHTPAWLQTIWKHTPVWLQAIISPTSLNIPFPILALIFAGAGAGFFLWLMAVLPAALPRSWVTVGWVLLALATGKAFVLAVLFPDLGRLGFGLFAAICFPLLALTWAYREMERLTAGGSRQTWPIVRALCVTTGITVLGGLLIAAIFTDLRYMVKVNEFLGVKLALSVPLLFFGAILITDGVARSDETLAVWWGRVTANLKSFFAQPLYLWGILVALAALVVVALMLARSGNDSGVGVSDLELRFRSILEQWLIARPRTKEFLLGHPLFMLGMAAALRKQRILALILLVGGAIGQVDVLNTFCHAHTPVLLSLLRVVNGLWLGVIIGAIAMMIFFRAPRKAAKGNA